MLANFYVREGQSVYHRVSKRAGKILRVYPFQDKANILVKFDDGAMKSYLRTDLERPKATH